MGMIILNGKEYTSMPKDGFPPLIYSLEEREIGVWTDGKPLYQKCYPIIIADGNIQSIDSTFEPKKVEVATYYDSQSVFENSFVYDGSNLVTVWIGQGYIQCHSNSVYIGKSAVVILYYTKSTDVAGSGKYTTYGGLAHHYSTNEQIVGTWIDGKPIYEKSYNVGSIARNTRAEVDSTLSIDKIISCNGGAYSSTYNQKYPMPFVHTNTTAYAIMVYTISGVLYAETGNDMPVSECHITVRYTKTTD